MVLLPVKCRNSIVNEFKGGPEIPIFMVMRNEDGSLTPDMQPMVLKATYKQGTEVIKGKLLVSMLIKGRELYSYMRHVLKLASTQKLEIFFGLEDDTESSATLLTRDDCRLEQSKIRPEVFTHIIVRYSQQFLIRNQHMDNLESIAEDMVEYESQQTRGAGKSPANAQGQQFANFHTEGLSEEEEYRLALKMSLEHVSEEAKDGEARHVEPMAGKSRCDYSYNAGEGCAEQRQAFV